MFNIHFFKFILSITFLVLLIRLNNCILYNWNLLNDGNRLCYIYFSFILFFFQKSSDIFFHQVALLLKIILKLRNLFTFITARYREIVFINVVFKISLYFLLIHNFFVFVKFLKRFKLLPINKNKIFCFNVYMFCLLNKILRFHYFSSTGNYKDSFWIK